MKARTIIESATIVWHKLWVSLPKAVYYKYGFAKRLVSICEDFDRYEFEYLKVKPRIITIPTEINAFESIRKVIKDQIGTILLITMKP